MNTKKRLIEAKPESKEFQDFMSSMNHPASKMWMDHFMPNYQKYLKEMADSDVSPSDSGTEPQMGAARGTTVGDAVNATANLTVYATLEILNSVIRGFTRYLDDSFVRKYTTENAVFKIPLTEYAEAVTAIGTVAAGELNHTEKSISYATVDLSSTSTVESERGGKVTWTRALLEDVTFDVQAEMMEGLGHAIAVEMMMSILKEVVCATKQGVEQTTSAQILDWENTAGYTSGYTNTTGVITISSASQISWAEFLSIVGAVDIGITDGTSWLETEWYGKKTYGPADYVLVAPNIYWQLLNIIQTTNVLYEGSTDPINQGKIKLALGCTIVKQSLLPTGVVVALNSEKAIALVTRRSLKIEPVMFPVWNEYGFIGTVRYGVTRLFLGAIAIGATTAGLDAITTGSED